MRTRWQLVALVLAAVLLDACGGDGGGSGDGGSSAAANTTNTTPPQTYTVGGSLTGLSTSALTLQLNGAQDLVLAGNGPFTFSPSLPTGAAYTVTIKAQPGNPPQTCVLSNATGSVANANVANVSVECTDNAYAVGGKVNGLSGSGLVLQNNGGDDLPVTASGDFVFGSHVRTGSTYSVTVSLQPVNPSQTCVVSSGSGTVSAADVGNVAVSCSTNSYSAGGTVSGLAGSGLVLELNGSRDLPVGTNGNFTFPGVLASGSVYAVAVKAQPTNPYQTCVATNSSGNVGGSAITNISVSCTTNSYSVAGSVTGLAGSGLVLQLNGGQDLPVGANGGFVFPTELTSGSQYAVTIKTQSAMHREVCIATNASGIVAGSGIGTVKIDCTVVLGFVYVVGTNNHVIEYGIHPQTGALLPLGSTVSIGNSPRNLVAAPNGATLYGSDLASDSIYVFAVDSSKGTLSAVGTPVPTGPPGSGAYGIAIAPSGKFLYVSNLFTGNVVVFSIDPVTGGLTAPAVATSVPGSTFIDLAITPDGQFLYLLSLNGNASPTLTAYSINAATGALTAGATIAPGPVDHGLVIDPLGRFLYVHSYVGTPSTQIVTTVLPFAIDSGTGALTSVGTGTSVVNNGDQLVVDPSGRYAYLLDTLGVFPVNDNHIDAFSIDQSSGALTSIGTPTLVHAHTGEIVCDPSGQFVFVGSFAYAGADASSTWYDVSGYAIGPTGPTTGQLAPAGLGIPRTGMSTTFSAIAVVE